MGTASSEFNDCLELSDLETEKGERMAFLQSCAADPGFQGYLTTSGFTVVFLSPVLGSFTFLTNTR